MKVVYNGCFGGFCLSRDAVILGRKLSGDEKWNYPSIKGDIYECGTVSDSDYGFLDDKIARNDYFLVSVVESLGDEASGSCSELKIKDIPDGVEFEITSYDGLESVVPPRQSW